MPRVVSVFLPTWPTDRLTRELRHSARPVEGGTAGKGSRTEESAHPRLPDAPLILTSRTGSSRVVFAANFAAQALGLRVGMAATNAQAMVAGLVVKDADPASDAAGLEKLAIWPQAEIICLPT